MANAINKTVEKDALDQLDDLYVRLTKVDEAILKLSSDALAASKSVGSIKTPGGLGDSVSSNQAYTDELLRQSKIIDGLQAALTSLGKVRSVTAKQTADEAVNQRILNQNAIQQAKLISNLTSEYDKLSLKLSLAEKGAKNIGAIYGSTSKEFLTAAKNVQILRTEVGNIDRALGDNKRNVGNYTGGYNALGTSISRLAQELPNAGQSFQIFALSIGNNFAQVKDAIDQIILKNKELVASGQPTVSIFKQIASEVFSLNTVFYVAIALFIAFSKQIGEYTSKLLEGAKSNDVYTKSLEQITTASIEGQKNATSELIALKANLEIAKDVTASYKEREIAVKNLQDQYPFYFENLTKEQILAGDTAEAERQLTLAIISRAKANAAVSKITENQSKIIDLEQERIKLSKDLESAKLREARAIQNAANVSGKASESAAFAAVDASNSVANAQAALANNQRQLNNLNAINNNLTNYAIGNQKLAIGLDEKAIKTKTEKQKRDLEEVKTFAAGTQSLLDDYEQQIKAIEKLRQANSTTFEQYAYYTNAIDKLKFAIHTITGFEKELQDLSKKGIDVFKKRAEAMNENIAAFEALKRSTDDYIRSIPLDFIGSSNFKSLERFADGSFNRLYKSASTFKDKFAIVFQAIGEVAKDTFSYIQQLGQQDYEAAVERLTNQYNIDLAFAGDNAAAKAEIDKQYEEKKKQLERQRAQDQKASSIFSAVINTAEAVVAALANPGGPAGVALAALVGVLGAAQIALIASQPLPAYEMGGRTDKDGKILVNDAKGNRYQEKIVTPDGRVLTPSSRNAVLNVPKGTDIFTPEQWDEMKARGIAGSSIPQNASMTARQIESLRHVGIDYDRMTDSFMTAVSKLPEGDTFIQYKDGLRDQIAMVRNGQKQVLYNASLKIKSTKR